MCEIDLLLSHKITYHRNVSNAVFKTLYTVVLFIEK